MFGALEFFNQLESKSVDWILDNCTSRTYNSGSYAARQGSSNDAIQIVVHGVYEVIDQHSNAVLREIGPGALIGEISLLDGGIASASIKAVENGETLVLPVDGLVEKLRVDGVFAADFYRAVARTLARRLRNRPFVPDCSDASIAVPAANNSSTEQQLIQQISRFKACMSELDLGILNVRPDVPELTSRMIKAWRAMGRILENLMRAEPDEARRARIGRIARDEVLPYLLLSQCGDRWHSKPRGYAGDYFTIELMYRNDPTGMGRIGPIFDRVLLDLPPCVAVRNRRHILRDVIVSLLQEIPGRSIQISALACGPAREVLDVFESELRDEARSRLFVTAIDIDLEALAYLDSSVKRLGLQKNVMIVHGNLIHLATGRQKLDLPPQDLMYSVGLIDYFSDKFVVDLMDWVNERLALNGRCILGNFDARNPVKALMDYVVDWKLQHRTADDLNRLYRQSRFACNCSRVIYESEGINLFAECVKERKH